MEYRRNFKILVLSPFCLGSSMFRFEMLGVNGVLLCAKLLFFTLYNNVKNRQYGSRVYKEQDSIPIYTKLHPCLDLQRHYEDLVELVKEDFTFSYFKIICLYIVTFPKRRFFEEGS